MLRINRIDKKALASGCSVTTTGVSAEGEHGNRDGAFSCNLCKFATDTQISFEAHILIHQVCASCTCRIRNGSIIHFLFRIKDTEMPFNARSAECLSRPRPRGVHTFSFSTGSRRLRPQTFVQIHGESVRVSTLNALRPFGDISITIRYCENGQKLPPRGINPTTHQNCWATPATHEDETKSAGSYLTGPGYRLFLLGPEIILVCGCENVAGKLRQKW